MILRRAMSQDASIRGGRVTILRSEGLSMEVQPTSAPPRQDSSTFSVDIAMQIASWTWFGLLSFPFVLFIAVVWRLTETEGLRASDDLANRWFIGTMIYMAVGIPAAFFIRSRIFKGYWQGQLVSPRNYLFGMLLIWCALELGGLLSLIGCLMSGKLVPTLVPGLLAFMLFTPLWPNGHAMTRRLKNEHDPADYEEPR